LLAVSGPTPLWYLTRGTGLVSLILLTLALVLGVVTTSRWRSPSWPRFASAGLHRNVSLLVLVFLAAHIVTAELDAFAPLGWLAVIAPFASSYRPIWLGLGTVAFDIVVAVAVTSLLRARIGFAAWRFVHWLAYLCWPVALVHGLGTGTDSRVGWAQALDLACVVAVLAAVSWRLFKRVERTKGESGSRPAVRLVAAAGAAAAVVGVAVWSFTGPLRPGWARRAGTPSNLLATSRTPASSRATGPVPAAARSAPTGLPALPFDAVLTGALRQSGSDDSGQVTITIDTRVSGAMSGDLTVVLRGQAAGSGVSLASSSVTFGPSGAPTTYRGQVILLNGDQLVASVTSPGGSQITLGVLLQIDPSTGSVKGTIHAGPVARGQTSQVGDGDADRGR
jgi:sulfoxide reductase heme-binding subunit YedZ